MDLYSPPPHFQIQIQIYLGVRLCGCGCGCGCGCKRRLRKERNESKRETLPAYKTKGENKLKTKNEEGTHRYSLTHTGKSTIKI